MFYLRKFETLKHKIIERRGFRGGSDEKKEENVTRTINYSGWPSSPLLKVIKEFKCTVLTEFLSK